MPATRPGRSARTARCAIVRVPVADRQKLCDLLNRFYSHTEPDIESFEHAVEEFKDRVPDLGRGLADKIKTAHADNPRFQKAFDAFFQLCQTALNPNIRREAVDEMLVQHLLTGSGGLEALSTSPRQIPRLLRSARGHAAKRILAPCATVLAVMRVPVRAAVVRHGTAVTTAAKP